MVPPLHCTLLQQEEDNQCDIPERDTPQEMQKNDWGYTKWTWHFLEQFTAWHCIAAAPSSLVPYTLSQLPAAEIRIFW